MIESIKAHLAKYEAAASQAEAGVQEGNDALKGETWTRTGSLYWTWTFDEKVRGPSNSAQAELTAAMRGFKATQSYITTDNFLTGEQKERLGTAVQTQKSDLDAASDRMRGLRNRVIELQQTANKNGKTKWIAWFREPDPFLATINDWSKDLPPEERPALLPGQPEATQANGGTEKPPLTPREAWWPPDTYSKLDHGGVKKVYNQINKTRRTVDLLATYEASHITAKDYPALAKALSREQVKTQDLQPMLYWRMQGAMAAKDSNLKGQAETLFGPLARVEAIWQILKDNTRQQGGRLIVDNIDAVTKSVNAQAGAPGATRNLVNFFLGGLGAPFNAAPQNPRNAVPAAHALLPNVAFVYDSRTRQSKAVPLDDTAQAELRALSEKTQSAPIKGVRP